MTFGVSLLQTYFLHSFNFCEINSAANNFFIAIIETCWIIRKLIEIVIEHQSMFIYNINKTMEDKALKEFAYRFSSHREERCLERRRNPQKQNLPISISHFVGKFFDEDMIYCCSSLLKQNWN